MRSSRYTYGDLSKISNRFGFNQPANSGGGTSSASFSNSAPRRHYVSARAMGSRIPLSNDSIPRINRVQSLTSAPGTQSLKAGPGPKSKLKVLNYEEEGETEYGVTTRRSTSLPPYSTYTSPANANSVPVRAKPTVTTILRQQHVLERAERREKEKLDSLTVSNSVMFESKNVAKQLEKRDAEVKKAAEAKRLLQARLAYERAKAASRLIAEEKQKIANGTRQKEKEWYSSLLEQREAERERRKSMTEQLQKAFADSKRSFDDMLQLKKAKAAKMKEEMEKLHLAAKEKQKEAEMARQDKIQQIQACKLALKKSKESTTNPNQFHRSIAIPETQIKLRLQQEEEKRKLEEARKKIQAEKQLKSVKLIRAMKKIQHFESKKQNTSRVHENQSESTDKTLGDDPFIQPLTLSAIEKQTEELSNFDVKSGEIEQMLEELRKLKEENLMKKQNEDYWRKGRVTTVKPARCWVKVVGAADTATGTTTPVPSTINILHGASNSKNHTSSDSKQKQTTTTATYDSSQDGSSFRKPFSVFTIGKH